MKILTSKFFFSLLVQVFGIQQNLQFYGKVQVPFPNTVPTCLLIKYSKAMSNTACGGLCLQNPDCTLFCKSGSACSLYSAIATKNWNPTKFGITTQNGEESTSQCYSTWAGFNNDIIHLAQWSSSSVDQINGLPLSDFPDGFYCVGNEFIFHTMYENSPWLRAEFSTPKSSKKIIIKVRRGTIDTFFMNAEIRVGNDPSTGIFTNPLFASYLNMAPSDQILTFERATPLVGKYVSIQIMGTQTWLLIGEMAIIQG